MHDRAVGRPALIPQEHRQSAQEYLSHFRASVTAYGTYVDVSTGRLSPKPRLPYAQPVEPKVTCTGQQGRGAGTTERGRAVLFVRAHVHSLVHARAQTLPKSGRQPKRQRGGGRLHAD
jgi:hypothetical protein